MSPHRSSSGDHRSTAPRTASLTRFIFVRAAIPVCIIFLSCFCLLDWIAQDQMRSHLKRELQVWDADTQRASEKEEAGLSDGFASLAEMSGVAPLLQDSSQINRNAQSIGARLEHLKPMLDDDLYAVAGLDGRTVLTLRRSGTNLVPANQQAPVVSRRALIDIDGQYYFVSSRQIERSGKRAGWAISGRRWTRAVPFGTAGYVLVKNGTVNEASGSPAALVLSPGSPVAGCANLEPTCDTEFDGKQMVLLRSAAPASGDKAAIYVVQRFDVVTAPLLAMTRGLMLAGALLSVLCALGLAVLAGRAISAPLESLTRSCSQAQESQHFSEIDVPKSRIAEVNALGVTLHAAVQSIQDGQSRLTQAYFQFMGAIVALLDARDAYTAGHSHRVSAYSEALAKDFGLPPEQVDDIRVAALLHDIGKIGVPDEILRKHDRLTKEEFELMKQHPTIGRKVLEQVVQFDKYLDAVELHHESLDGSGYPRGLRGEQIPISARIVKVADVYDALSTDRPYRKGMSRDQVHAILRDGAGTQFDRMLVEVFLSRSVPRFEQRSDLADLLRAVAGNHSRQGAKSAIAS